MRPLAAFLVAAALAACTFDPDAVSARPGGSDARADGPGSEPGADAEATADGAAAPDARAAIDASVFAVRWNMAGLAVVGVDHPGTWAADPGTVCDGAIWSVTGDVHGTVDDALFLRYRYSGSALDCSVPVVSGRYQVNLLFAEVYEGPGCDNGSEGTSSRDFSVTVEGVLRFASVKPFEDGGGCAVSTTSTTGHPFVRTVTTDVTDGAVTIRLSPAYGYAMLSALEIVAD